jgi:hypothetical protein
MERPVEVRGREDTVVRNVAYLICIVATHSPQTVDLLLQELL